MQFVLVNRNTGEWCEAGCSVCGVYFVQEETLFESYPVDSEHIKGEIEKEEYEMLCEPQVTVKREGATLNLKEVKDILIEDDVVSVKPKFKIRIEKLTERLSDRSENEPVLVSIP